MEKKIWMFWLQGWDNATELSKTCLQSWIDLNPDWTVVPLDRENISEYLDLDDITDGFYSKKPISCTVDIINLNLLKKYGGIWVDSTVLCLKPLDDWLDEYILKQGLFVYKFEPIVPVNDGSDKIRLLGTWFIAANPENYIIDRWCKEYNKYWLGRNEPTYYFDFHYLFYDLYHADSRFRQIFDAIPLKTSQQIHYLSQFINKPLTKEIAAKVTSGDFDMVKFQNVYVDRSYEGEEVVKKLLLGKHSNHLEQSAEIVGFNEMYKLARDYYLNE